MAGAADAQSVSHRVERLLDAMAAADPEARAAGEDLVRTLMEFYGAGLARIVAIVRENEAPQEDPAARAVLGRLVADDLVSSLLVLHDLHPTGTEQRIADALEKVRPYLGSHAGGVEYLGLDTDGVVHLRLAGSCHGCPSSTVTVRLAIEQAIEAAAPEVTGIDVEGVVVEPPAPTADGHPLLPLEPVGHPRPPANDAPTWIDLDGVPPPPPGALVPTVLAGTAAVLCTVDGVWYAYRDRCPGCGAELAAARLEGAVLACGCGRRFDVHRAGRALDGAGHLDPLPLLVEDGRVRVAVRATVPP